MTQPTGQDPLAALRQADPVDPERLPSASLARVRARVQETTVMNEQQRSRTPRLRLALGGATVLAAALALAVIALPRGAAPGADPSPSETPGGGIGMCVEQYSPETLPNRDFAFDGTVTAIDADEVTFTVNEAFAGDLGAQVTLTASGMTGTSITSLDGPTLSIGGRYLVSGDDEFVWNCGFTAEYEAGLAAEWAAALADR